MKKLLLILTVSVLAVTIVTAQSPQSQSSADEDPLDGLSDLVDLADMEIPPYSDSDFNAAVVFVRLPPSTLSLLTSSERLDLLDYYNADSIADVVNVMEGFSHLIRPLTNNYLKLQVTPASTLTVKILPYGKKQVAVTAYTVGDSLQAADTDLKFFDEDMTQLDTKKFIRPATMADFFNFKGVDSNTRKELLDLVPFATVEYTFEPGSNRLHARMTAGEFLGKETNDKITPYLQRDRYYKWTGKKFQLEK